MKFFWGGETFDWFLGGLRCSHNLFRDQSTHYGTKQMTKDHQAIFSVNPRNPSLSIFIINSRNPSFPSVFSPFFLIRTLSSYYGTSGFPLFSRNPSFLVITGQLPTLLSIPEFPPFLLITGRVPTFLFFFVVNPGKPFFPSLFLGNMRPALHHVLHMAFWYQGNWRRI